MERNFDYLRDVSFVARFSNLLKSVSIYAEAKNQIENLLLFSCVFSVIHSIGIYVMLILWTFNTIFGHLAFPFSHCLIIWVDSCMLLNLNSLFFRLIIPISLYVALYGILIRWKIVKLERVRARVCVYLVFVCIRTVNLKVNEKFVACIRSHLMGEFVCINLKKRARWVCWLPLHKICPIHFWCRSSIRRNLWRDKCTVG